MFLSRYKLYQSESGTLCGLGILQHITGPNKDIRDLSVKIVVPHIVIPRIWDVRHHQNVKMLHRRVLWCVLDQFGLYK